MKRTTIFLPEGAERDLKALAEREGEPVASLIREAIADYLVRRRSSGAKEPGFVAAGRSGQSDVAARHEDLLWKDLEPHGAAAPPAKPSGRSAKPRARKSARRPAR